jgi:hypothetical protein
VHGGPGPACARMPRRAMYTPKVSRGAPANDEDEGGLDPRQLVDWVYYALRAARRRVWLVLASAALFGAAAALLAWAIPYRYYVETRLLTQRPDVNTVLSGPGRSVASDAAAATQGIADSVHRRDNLLALIGQTGLVRNWRETRSPVGRLRDRLMFGHPPDDKDLADLLVGILEKELLAWAKDGAVSIAVTWSDPDMAERIVDTALQNFLETRHVNEMAILGESISLLEQRQTEARQGLDHAIAAARAVPAPKARVPSVRELLPLPTEPDEASLELARLRSTIGAKRRAVEDLVSFRDRKIAELQTQLAEQQAVYAESHPVVVNIKRRLEALAADSPQLAALRQELQEVEARYYERGGSPADLDDVSHARATPPPSAPAVITALEAPARDPGEEYARSQLAAAITRYYTVVDRLEAVRLERDAARASIKYRYVVVRPPLRPREPENRARKMAIPIVGVAAGLFFGLVLAVAQELRQGRVAETWQVERGLGLPILAELPAHPALRNPKGAA